MKFTILVLVSVGVLNVCAGRVFDERQNAIQEIEKKLSEVQALAKQVLTAVQGEISNTNKSTTEKDAINQLNAKAANTKVQFECDARAVIRTAIVQSKPMSVIYCIRNVTYFGVDKIQKVRDESYKKVLNVKINKLQKTGFDEYAVGATISGLQELIDQAKVKIRECSTTDIQTIKKQALTNCNSASLILGEIEVCVHEPVLNTEYIKMRQGIERAFTGALNELNKDLEKCLIQNKTYSLISNS